MELAAQMWTYPSTKNKVMDVELATVFAGALDGFIQQREELLEENQRLKSALSQIESAVIRAIDAGYGR
jgi:hypothetical protein